MPRSRSIFTPKIKAVGPTAAAGGSVTHTRMEGRKEGRKARKYIMMLPNHFHKLDKGYSVKTITGNGVR